MDKKFEAICKRCGECCGASDDPCLNLVKTKDGLYFCKDYKNRLKEQKTVSGKTFRCVPIREHIEKGTLKSGCSYCAIRLLRE
ncbi:MAG: hypothetical protein ACE5JK_01105 [Candidatus Omnitrophota bacterium]